jgi:hypothetical protein
VREWGGTSSTVQTYIRKARKAELISERIEGGKRLYVTIEKKDKS